LGPAGDVGRKIGAQRGALGVKNTHKGALGDPKHVKGKNRTYDLSYRELRINVPVGLRKFLSQLTLNLYNRRTTGHRPTTLESSDSK